MANNSSRRMVLGWGLVVGSMASLVVARCYTGLAGSAGLVGGMLLGVDRPSSSIWVLLAAAWLVGFRGPWTS